MRRASIEGPLIKRGRDVVGGFKFAPELWEWVYKEFPGFAGGLVRITVEEVCEEGGDGRAEAGEEVLHG